MNAQLIEYIKNLIPLCDIKKEENQRELHKNILIGKIGAGKILFHSGHDNEFTYYLLNGEPSLVDSNGNKSVLKSGDTRCRFPVGYDQSYKYTVTALTNAGYLKINSRMLDTILTWDQTTTPLLRRPYKGEKNREQINWMSKILELDLFHRIPPTNIQAMFLRFVSVKAPKGTVVVEQNSEASSYFVIKSGRAAVYRTDAEPSAQPHKLADLGPGDAFGEEGLVAGIPRNASVVMLEDGELARLAKEDFIELLKKPVIRSVDYKQALTMAQSGAQFIDARTEHEYQHNHLANSRNIPLLSIRESSRELDNNQAYIVYCDTGSRSSAACYILIQQGFDAYLLENGLNMVPSDTIIHPDKN